MAVISIKQNPERKIRRKINWSIKQIKRLIREQSTYIAELALSAEENHTRETNREVYALAEVIQEAITLEGSLDLILKKNSGYHIIRKELETCLIELRNLTDSFQYQSQKATNTLFLLQHILIACKSPFLLVKERKDLIETIIVPTEILYQARLQLFPPEKMMVAAGRNNDGIVTITALFDTTGDNSSSSVDQDQKKNLPASLYMEKTGSYYAMWLHSHPGLGQYSCNPSTKDHENIRKLQKHYGPFLIGAILSEDGHINFWGDALEKKIIDMKIVGTGIQKEDCDGFKFKLV